MQLTRERERGATKKNYPHFFISFPLVSKKKLCVFLYQCMCVCISTLAAIHKYSSKKKFTIKIAHERIISRSMCGNNNMWKKNILKINEKMNCIIRGFAVCISKRKKNWKHFFVLLCSPWKYQPSHKIYCRKKGNNLIVF
jgi:hypothetical protein